MGRMEYHGRCWDCGVDDDGVEADEVVVVGSSCGVDEPIDAGWGCVGAGAGCDGHGVVAPVTAAPVGGTGVAETVGGKRKLRVDDCGCCCCGCSQSITRSSGSSKNCDSASATGLVEVRKLEYDATAPDGGVGRAQVS